MRVRKLISVPLLLLLVVSVAGSVGSAEGGVYLVERLLEQFAGALIGGAFTFFGAVIAMRQQLKDLAREQLEMWAEIREMRTKGEESSKGIHDRISRHLEDHARGGFR